MKIPFTVAGASVFIIIFGIQLYFGFYMIQQFNNQISNNNYSTAPSMKLLKRDISEIDNPMWNERQSEIKIWPPNQPIPVRV